MILGPDGEIRYIIRKSVWQEQCDYMFGSGCPYWRFAEGGHRVPAEKLFYPLHRD